ncbi:MAG: D-glycero-beta-D-manno-heptose-7-phosphate kinase [Pseudomonadota bacterium]
MPKKAVMTADITATRNQPASPQDRLKAVRRFPSLCILVVGDVMLDHFIRGSVSRISPEAPVPVVEVADETFKPGGAANVASNLLALGAKVALCGLIGRDGTGERLRGLLTELGADVSGLICEDGRPTTLKARILSRGAMSGAAQQLLRIDRELRGPPRAGTREAMFEHLREAARVADAIIVSDYGKGLIDDGFVAELRRAAPEGLIAADPKALDFRRYRGATVVTPNLRETEMASHMSIDGPETLKAAGERLLAEVGCPWLLVTQGEEGMTLFSRSAPAEHIPTAAREVFDVTGAGDTVISTFTLGMAAGLEAVEAAGIANIAAGVVVGEVGTATVSAARLEGLLGGRS